MQGWIDITYLSQDGKLRLTRGNKGVFDSSDLFKACTIQKLCCTDRACAKRLQMQDLAQLSVASVAVLLDRNMLLCLVQSILSVMTDLHQLGTQLGQQQHVDGDRHPLCAHEGSLPQAEATGRP